MPPSRAGRANNSRSRSPGGALPEIVGRNSARMTASRDSSSSLMLGVVWLGGWWLVVGGGGWLVVVVRWLVCG